MIFLYEVSESAAQVLHFLKLLDTAVDEENCVVLSCHKWPGLLFLSAREKELPRAVDAGGSAIRRIVFERVWFRRELLCECHCNR
jgi:hypothetical protein